MPVVAPMAAWVLAALLALAALLYAAQLVRFARGLRRVLAGTLPPRPDAPLFASVVVPARNEGACLGACLDALRASTHPAFEVIVVDDFSDDDTPDVAARHAAEDDRVRLVRLADRYESAAAGHKGAALADGIAEARGQLLLTTDADCTVHPGWIDAMVRTFTSERVGFVGGWVRMLPTTVFGRMQAVEFAGLVGAGAGALGAGDPNMCNSASMAYPRRVYDALRPPHRRAASPFDDEFLLHEIAAHPSLTPRFCPFPEAVVTTAPEPTFGAYWAQRRRWAATGAAYDAPGAAYTARLTWAFNALLLAGAALFATPLWPVWAAAFVLKTASEALVLVPTVRHLGLGRLLWQFVPQQLVQIPLTVALGLATLAAPPAWKGRRTAPLVPARTVTARA